eukprot:188532-Rhodomonas_salina.2
MRTNIYCLSRSSESDLRQTAVELDEEGGCERSAAAGFVCKRLHPAPHACQTQPRSRASAVASSCGVCVCDAQHFCTEQASVGSRCASDDHFETTAIMASRYTRMSP